MEVATKIKKTRTPRDAERITRAALSLQLKDRVELKTKLEESITAEVETLQQAAKQAEQLANGTK